MKTAFGDARQSVNRQFFGPTKLGPVELKLRKSKVELRSPHINLLHTTNEKPSSLTSQRCLVLILSKKKTMEDFDRASARTTAFGAFGGLIGIGTALHKGHPVPRTVGLTALSFAMVGTALFGTERLAAVAMRGGPLEDELGRTAFLMLTHATAGFFGGSLLGALYKGSPLQGATLFVPMMTGFGFVESMFQDMVDEGRFSHQIGNDSKAAASQKVQGSRS
jgi:hypothetical protein